MVVKVTDSYEEELTCFLYERSLYKEYYIAFVPDTLEEISLLRKDSFYLCIENNKIVGCLGTYISNEQKVVRLLGPIIDKKYFDKYIDILYKKCLQSLPEDIAELKIAFYADNVLCRRWCEKNGFYMYNAEATMVYNKELFIEREIPPKVILKHYEPRYQKGLEAVHPKGTFFTLKELINSISANHHLILALIQDEVQGYVYFEKTQDRKKGEIELLHVREDKRNRGYGTVLLNKAVKELINDKVEQITINVRVTNYDAQKLYKRTGFIEKETIYAYKKQINTQIKTE